MSEFSFKKKKLYRKADANLTLWVLVNENIGGLSSREWFKLEYREIFSLIMGMDSWTLEKCLIVR